MVSVSQNTNCRKGPGLQYDIVGTLLIGVQAEEVGVSADGQFWVIKNPQQAGECWLWGYYASVVGQTSGLPKLTPPPTPTLAFGWTGTWTTSHGVPGMMHETFIITLEQTHLNVTGSLNGLVALSASLSPDGSILTGTWDDGHTSGPFVFKMINMNQFIGN